MGRYRAIILFGLVALAAGCDWSREDGVARDQSPPPFGVPILTSYAEHIPAEWNKTPRTFIATAIEDHDLDRCERILAGAASKYPPGFVEAHLDGVILVRRLWIQGLPAGRTYYGRVIVVASASPGGSLDADEIERTFHHELSSVLLHTYPDRFDRAAWERTNVRSYFWDGPGQPRSAGLSSVEPSETWRARGFLHEYAAFQLEEDFNAMAEVLFASSAEYRSVVLANEVLATKMDLMKSFYRAISAEFSEEWFRRLESGR